MAKEAAELHFKVASEEWEFEAIHRLNHMAFAEEIGQHPASPSRRLVDAFDSENTYFICLSAASGPCDLLGMVALRERRPFSLDFKVPGLDALLPPSVRSAEVRLLCVRPEHRRGLVLPGLLRALAEHCIGRGHDLLLISAFVPRLRLYQGLGFEPFGPLVGCEAAWFQPMLLKPSRFRDASRRLQRLCAHAGRGSEAPRP